MAAEKNPFDLEGRDGGPDRAHPAKTWTAEEQAEKLTGYLEIAPEYWAQIRYGTHVRYVTKDGQFRTGGFVVKNPFDMKARGAADEKRFMKLQNGFNDKAHGYQCWVFAYEDVARVYMKPDAAVVMILHRLDGAVQGLNANIRKVVEHAKKLEARLAALERP